jgi:hypothetical protein
MQLYVDFNIDTLFGRPDFRTERSALIDLQLDNTRLGDAYEDSLCKQLENHKVESRVTLIFQIKEQEWNNRADVQFNKIDRDIKRAMECAAKKYRCSKYKKHPWSENNCLATYHIRYWQKREKIRN